MKRHVVLPASGVAVVSTDVHGNDEDMARLEEAFLTELAERDAFWIILGDVVHAPSDDARVDRPELYDFDDGTARIVERVLRLQRAHPDRVLFVLGNHDHGHAGGPHTHKFHEDEVDALERKMTRAERARLEELLAPALLAVAAPCGVLMTHGAPDDSFEDIRALDGMPLDVASMTPEQRTIARAMLTSYGQPDDVARRMLANVSRGLGFDLGVVVHGHDRDENGYFVEGSHQICPCLFGAPRANKRYVRLDLSARYDDAHALRDGIEVRRLY